MMHSANDSLILDGIQEPELSDFLAWRERVRGTNISSKTLLATDYLNHFNEIAMLVEMVPDVPEMVEECRAWQPKGYADHFRASGFSARELAVEAYGHVPSKFRGPFEATIDQMTAVAASALERIDTALRKGDADRLRRDCMASADMMRRIILVANAIIHGDAQVMCQSEIDEYLGR